MPRAQSKAVCSERYWAHLVFNAFYKLLLRWYFVLKKMDIRAIRTLPFPPTSTFTPEIVRRIKEIPDESIEYTKGEIEWIKRALENLSYMLACAKELNLNESIEQIEFRKKQFETALKRKK